MRNFYVYQYTDPITEKPVYIGKGTQLRLFYHWHNKTNHYNKRFGEYLESLEARQLTPTIEKIADELTNYEAYVLEFRTIQKYGRLDIDSTGILFNRSIGFEHFNINIRSLSDTDLIDYLTSVHFNVIELPEDEKITICECYLNGDGIQKIIRKFGHSPYKIKQVLAERNIQIRRQGGQIGENNGMFGKTRENTAYFLGHRHTPESLAKISNSGKKPIEINGVQYPSRTQAAIDLGISYSTLNRRIKEL